MVLIKSDHTSIEYNNKGKNIKSTVVNRINKRVINMDLKNKDVAYIQFRKDITKFKKLLEEKKTKNVINLKETFLRKLISAELTKSIGLKQAKLESINNDNSKLILKKDLKLKFGNDKIVEFENLLKKLENEEKKIIDDLTLINFEINDSNSFALRFEEKKLNIFNERNKVKEQNVVINNEITSLSKDIEETKELLDNQIKTKNQNYTQRCKIVEQNIVIRPFSKRFIVLKNEIDINSSNTNISNNNMKNSKSSIVSSIPINSSLTQPSDNYNINYTVSLNRKELSIKDQHSKKKTMMNFYANHILSIRNNLIEEKIKNVNEEINWKQQEIQLMINSYISKLVNSIDENNKSINNLGYNCFFINVLNDKLFNKTDNITNNQIHPSSLEKLDNLELSFINEYQISIIIDIIHNFIRKDFNLNVYLYEYENESNIIRKNILDTRKNSSYVENIEAETLNLLKNIPNEKSIFALVFKFLSTSTGNYCNLVLYFKKLKKTKKHRKIDVNSNINTNDSGNYIDNTKKSSYINDDFSNILLSYLKENSLMLSHINKTKITKDNMSSNINEDQYFNDQNNCEINNSSNSNSNLDFSIINSVERKEKSSSNYAKNFISQFLMDLNYLSARYNSSFTFVELKDCIESDDLLSYFECIKY